MKEQTIEVITTGTSGICELPESEAKVFYATLLARLLKLYRLQRLSDEPRKPVSDETSISLPDTAKTISSKNIT